jgi:hypothetical protein
MNSPGLPRAIGRMLVYYLLPVAPALIFSTLGPSFVDAEGQLDFTFNEALTGLAIGMLTLPLWALLFVTMRPGNGFAAVHDRLFDLRVVARPVSSARPVSARASPVSDAVPDASPTFGPYHVLAPLGENAAGDWKLGFDARLLRKVWIRIVPSGNELLPATVHGLSRSGRIRWLTGRRGASENWDGFEAPTGQPLWTLLDRPLDWDETRYLLLDLAEELAAALKDGTLPPALSLDRVWITADGRAKLSDLPVPGVASGAESLPTRPGCVEPVREFLRQVAVASLLGKRVSAREAQAMTVARPLPLHARPVLDGLLKAQRPEVVAAELRANLQRPARVTRVRRWGMFAALAGIPLAVALFSILQMRPTSSLWLASRTSLPSRTLFIATSRSSTSDSNRRSKTKKPSKSTSPVRSATASRIPTSGEIPTSSGTFSRSIELSRKKSPCARRPPRPRLWNRRQSASIPCFITAKRKRR